MYQINILLRLKNRDYSYRAIEIYDAENLSPSGMLNFQKSKLQ